MIPGIKYFLTLVLLVPTASCSCQPLVAAEMPAEDAWQALPRYEYGQDMAALLAIDRAVIQAMHTPKTRSVCAKKLASLLTAEHTTLAARQYICLQLRQVGTPAEVPVLAKLLAKPETSQMARYALESIPGPESVTALRGALATLRDQPLVGVIHSVAARKDTAAVPILQRLADGQDEQVATAAIGALGNIAGDRAADFLAERAEQVGLPTPQDLAVSLLRCADAFQRVGNVGQAKVIYAKLSRPDQLVGVRRAALEGLLRLQADQATATILNWLTDPDPDRRRIALGHLHALASDPFETLLSRLAELPAAGQLAVIDLGIARHGQKMLPRAEALVQSDQPELKLAGIRCLGRIGDASSIGILVKTLSAGGELATAAEDALVHLPPKEVLPALLDVLKTRPDIRIPVIRVLVKLKSHDALEPLLAIASQSDPAQYGPALAGLREIADPDNTDTPRLVQLLLKTERGRHRDEVEKTILMVCNKLPDGVDRSEWVLASLAGADRSETPKFLPLLGRLGGPTALRMIQKSLASEDPAFRETATRAICNWPNAEVADQLLELARTSRNPTYRRWALRAAIRVITLKSERPEAKTLAMLQDAMKLAEGAAEKRLALERAATIRTMETVTWLARYLDAPQLDDSQLDVAQLAQVACQSIVELAHHRFLRHPNMDQFNPILEKVERISKDPTVVERAKRYRLGL